jgi:hypothetical protein
MKPDEKAKELLLDQTYNVAIVGSRSFESFEQFQDMDVFIQQHIAVDRIDSVISGGAVGADTLGAAFADAYKINLVTHLPDWKMYGKRAGMIRNTDIIRGSDIVFAFWDGKSKGTRHSIKLAKEMGKELHIYAF